MFERIVVLDGSEETERAVPMVAGVEISEKDVADAARYLAALKTAYAKRKVKSQAYPIEERPADRLSSEKPTVIITRDDLPRAGQPVYRDQQPSGSPPRWVRVLVRLILESSFR